MIDDQDAIKTLVGSEKQAKAATQTFDRMADAGVKIGQFVMAGAAVAGAALVGMVAKGTKSADELAGAINGVEAATGLADDSSTGFRDTMLDIYNNNFGDSFEDIGTAMAEVTKQTGFTGDKLKNTTEYALMLRDTFEFEVTESVRTAEMMMDTFGTTSEESYNLIAQGAQNGLDKNGDLLDTVNEYSMYFGGMGIEAEEMFNMLANGAEDGTFSVDKLGDAMKEFSIRSIDGSDATSKAFEDLGFDAGTMSESLAAGGEGARDSLFKIADALFEMQDPIAQNEAGVALFGTQWEDLGADGVNALLNVNGEMDATKSSMDDINNTKYDTVGEAISGIGRNFETGVMIPIGEKVLPIIQELADKFSENMPLIQGYIESSIDVAVGLFDGLATSVQWVSDNLSVIIPLVAGLAGGMAALTIIGTIKGLIDAWKTSTFIMTVAQSGLNAALLANPIGLIVGLIALLIAAGVALYMNWETVKAFAMNLHYSLQDTFQAIWAAGVEKFGAMIDWIVNAFWSFDTKTRSIVQGMKNAVINFFVQLWTGAVEKVQAMSTAVTNKAQEMKNNFINKVQEIKNGAINKFNEVKNGITGKISETVSNVRSKFGEAYDAIMSPINRAKSAVKTAIDTMKGFFNFNWKLPSIKMPTFSVSGSMNPINWIKDGVPKLSVNWNAKGGIFDRPTIFNTAQGLQGVGEAGPEAILPLNDKTYSGIGKGIADALSKMAQPQKTESEDNDRPIILQIDGKTFAKITGDYFGVEGAERIKNADRGLA